MAEGWGPGMARIPRVGETRNGETAVEEEMGEDGVILGHRVTL